MAKTFTARVDVYETVTDKIIADLESGVAPWRKPWVAGESRIGMSMPLRHCGTPYRGINVILLWIAASAAGYNNPHWLTYKQAAAFGANVRKGEKGTHVFFASQLRVEDAKAPVQANGVPGEKIINFMKSYTVFNVEQIDGLGERYAMPPASAPLAIDQARGDTFLCQKFFESLDIDIRGQDKARAFYVEKADYINMPPLAAFVDNESFAATLAHECIHATKHVSRLDRKIDCEKQVSYASEELVAELGAAFLCAILGISAAPSNAHASYIASWLQALKNDSRHIFRMASHAQKACDWLLAQGEEHVIAEDEEILEAA